MIDRELLRRYRARFGDTFTAERWAARPGDAVNAMMRAALTADGPPVTDEQIAADLAARLGPDDEPS